MSQQDASSFVCALEVGPMSQGSLHLLEPCSESRPQPQCCCLRLLVGAPWPLNTPRVHLTTCSHADNVFICGRNAILTFNKFYSSLSFYFHSLLRRDYCWIIGHSSLFLSDCLSCPFSYPSVHF